ncbi:MAG: ABC transporter substrate-binding protein [Thermotaleaceae bacterium]
MLKKIITTLLILMLALFQLTGCASQETSNPVSPGAENNPENKDISPKIVIDQNSAEVILPDEINRVVMTALPLPSIYALTNEPIQKIVGMHPGSKGAIENSIMGTMYPDLLSIESTFIEGTDINIEELLKLAPDLVFYWADYANQTKQLAEAGIPAIGVTTQGNGDVLLTLSSWLEIMGDVFEKTGEVKSVIQYGEKTLQEIDAKIKDIPEEERLKGLFLFHHSTQEIVVPGTGHYGDYWLEATGGKNVAKEIDVTANVNMEQIYQWNPEVIYISSFTTTLPEDLYNNSIPGQDWSKIDAVKNKRVYKEPVGVYRWYPPSGDAPLMLKWMANHQYPELFNYNMEEELKAYYKAFYDFDLSQEQIDGILDPLKETASGTAGLSKQK